MALVSLPSRPSGLLNRYAARYSRKRFGLVADPVKAASHHTGVLLGQGAEEMVVAKKWTRLDPAVRWLAVMVAAQQVGCSWCMDFGWYEGVATGVDPAKIRAVGTWRDSEPFDERERAALEFAEAASATPVQIDDELADRLRAHFREDELVELAGYIALENQRSRFNAALGLESQGFKNQCELPDAADRSAGQAPAPSALPQEAAHV